MSITCSNCNYVRPESTTSPGPACPICHTPYSEKDLRPTGVAKDIDNLGPRSMIALLAFIIAAGIGLYLLKAKYSPAEESNGTPADTVEQRRETDTSKLGAIPWSEDFHAGIASALGQNKVRGCGQFAYKLMPGKTSEYLVACIGMQGDKTGYLVFPNIGKVVGPIDLSK